MKNSYSPIIKGSKKRIKQGGKQTKRWSTKGDTHMTHEHRQNCSSLIFRKTHIKTTVKYSPE